jgi:hypothetical protein
MDQRTYAEKTKCIRPRLGKEARAKAVGLLDMLYTPTELAEELGLNLAMLYHQLLPAGLPHSKDSTGHIWIHGAEVSKWLVDFGTARRQPLAADEAYCLRCRQAVKLINPQRAKSGNVTLLKATCPICGATVNRGVKVR